MLHVSDLTFRIGPRLIIDRATAAIPAGAKVGLVGRNGAGKTTLFRLIAGEIAPEAGAITLPRHCRLGRVAQEAPAGMESLISIVLAADLERTALLGRRERTEDPHEIAEIETRLADIHAHSAEARAAAILHGLGFDMATQRGPCADLSGGWRMRVALAAVLFAEPDLLMLDEPTNYLDLEGTLWLYDYLARYPRTTLIISHDRELLDTAVDHILHLDQGKLTLYRGNYSQFDRQRREALVLQSKMKERQEAERKHLMSFVERFRAKASKARQAQSRLKRLERMEPVASIIEQAVLPFSIPGPTRPLSPPLIRFERAMAGYGEKVILRNLDLTILPDDRIALIGPNGNGKSTFAKLLTGRLSLSGGTMSHSPKLAHAYFAQHQIDELDPAGTPYSHVASLIPDAYEAQKRAAAAAIGFPGQKADTIVRSLSGGEKARLQFGLATFRGTHLLVLDEPTNHLDIDSRAALVEALNDYPGAIVLISHDRYLIEATCDRLWLVADGTIRPYEGDLEDYRKLVLAGGERNSAADSPASTKNAVASRADDRREAALKRVATAPLRKKLVEIEARIAKLTGLMARVDATLSGSAFRESPQKASELARQRAELVAAIAQAEEEWLEHSLALESAG